MINILLIDDEKKICEFVKAYLDKEGYKTDVAYNGNDAVDYLDNNQYDIVLLDRMLPDISGEEICSYIRNNCKLVNIAIIMLTAKTEDDDRIEGFELGCDDYICKPFNVKELILRIKAVLKRSHDLETNEKISFKNEIEINTKTHEVKVRGKSVILTNTEYKLLLVMASNPKKIYTREELLENVVEDHLEKFDRVIDSHIKNLRQKIEVDSRNCKIIKTVYGVGYKFEE
ncbi:transcriptional regulatory family protein [[Clostridium] bifermentans ATCC 638]|uniref:Stage 0 sporulation protein A homolog n=1 Tax=Paraclostridium bifermentans ATCC 638 = DSM 14991 TaxID=1233171 RepID=T4VEV2_PARBF|nr:response regulator [Paraclostridium bifermentans]EQK42249.1 transcriptional regulatory family protein [[Clostridium] bifermentans ATCC 638] [Paraclostridium bifermentans ATCC 638 = DSM 14991]MCR1874904.1 response regulator transcription factor [Paraclostridium bifermentans]RIZ59786.1 DNA-binding response regulator [Paraclostridium bifermentans]UAG19104.1 response regulator transcription factor [Paraclostridium bifermentans]UOW68812.1 response regulator transcription factor [Paraclostridium 